MEKEEIDCPFCGEQDFDKIGLKWHLTSGNCETFNNTSSDVTYKPVQKTTKGA